ncbi:hypothetical protein WJ972_06900 [Achromobacter insuavis]
MSTTNEDRQGAVLPAALQLPPDRLPPAAGAAGGPGSGAGAVAGASYGDKLNLMRNPAATLFDVSVSYGPAMRIRR